MEYVEANEAHLYPPKFLATLWVTGLPLIQLALKPLMLLRALGPSNGLCNGTHMILFQIRLCILVCHLLGGKCAVKTAFIPQITIKPSNEYMLIPMLYWQFPVHLAFAMTIKKSQGQSVAHVGLDLQIPVFSHEQLYVALSRCTSSQHIKVLFPEDEQGTKTTNIVYSEVLSNII
jgi:ATP-dependent DNA helicase PIF1